MPYIYQIHALYTFLFSYIYFCRYENIASKLGNDTEYRRSIRNRVWEQRINSPLFNVRIYAKVPLTLTLT